MELQSVPLLTILIWLVQLALIIHVLKTGRSRYWIMMLIFMPMIGGVAYFVIELLPEFSGSIAGQRAVRSVKQTLNPGADLRQNEAAWNQSPNVDNGRRYASSLLDMGKIDEAEQIINQALRGLFATEPTLLQLKAELLFEDGRTATHSRGRGRKRRRAGPCDDRVEGNRRSASRCPRPGSRGPRADHFASAVPILRSRVATPHGPPGWFGSRASSRLERAYVAARVSMRDRPSDPSRRNRTDLRESATGQVVTSRGHPARLA